MNKQIAETPAKAKTIVDEIIEIVHAEVGQYVGRTTVDEATLRFRIENLFNGTKAGPRIPLEVTEAELFAWFKDKAASYGVPGLRLTLYDHSDLFPEKNIGIIADADGASGFASGDTIDEAVANVVAKIETPAIKAARLRAQADAILAEAEKLNPAASP